MSNQVFIATLTWLESSLNSVVAHCTDKEIKRSLLIAKKAVGQALSDVLSE
jgi:hypothetical protein